ncbi:MAG TPA: mersacidin/lichenicidin family type 2 lantibiotic [Blastocatellia bacterium]|nr:mersacidin/lichenicidin family type 2 lantibiotic [Blastocatellia bacterium]
MSHMNIVRAWKDEEYRSTLSDAERAQMPANPAGDLDLIAGNEHQLLVAGAGSFWCTCLSECPSINLSCDMTGRFDCSFNVACILPDTTPIQPIYPLQG